MHMSSACGGHCRYMGRHSSNLVVVTDVLRGKEDIDFVCDLDEHQVCSKAHMVDHPVSIDGLCWRSARDKLLLVSPNCTELCPHTIVRSEDGIRLRF